MSGPRSARSSMRSSASAHSAICLAQPLWFWALVAIGIPFGLWVFIDCAFLRGDQGANKFGPDPRDAVMRDVRFEESERRHATPGFGFGSMVRNVIVAAAALAVAFLFMGPSSTLSALLTRGHRRKTMG